MFDYLILGFLLATIGCTILNGLCEVASTLFEWIKTIIALRIVKNNVKINDLQQSLEETQTRAIGFTADWEEDDYDYDDDDE